MTDWYVGTMGFSYDQWQGVFYPAGLAQSHRLAYYAERFSAVEMDSTFYATPAVSTVQRWAAVTPPDFKICPKVPREITHDLRLAGAADSLERFLDAMRLLGEKLGPVVLQFPPDFSAAGAGSLREFLGLLPPDIRFAVEFRHRSWLGEGTIELLRNHRVCWVAADYIHLPKMLWQTTDFIYLRFLGRHGRFATKTHEVLDKTVDLKNWLAQVQPHLDSTAAVYAFFNNDYAGYSPGTANRFKMMAGLETADLDVPQQGRLF